MDDFGVLVKHYGINPKGKSAPMAASKQPPKSHNNHDSVNQDPNFFSHSFSKSNSGGGSLFPHQNDDIFGFNSTHNTQTYVSGDVFDRVFQMPTNNSGGGGGGGGGGFEFDMESMFKGSTDSGAKSSDVNGGDDIWGFSESSSSTVEVGNADLLSSDPVDDFWGKMAKLGLDQRGVKRLGENKGDNDDLLPGFGRSFTVNDRMKNGANGHGGSFTAKSDPKKTVSHKPQETNFFDFDVSIDGGSIQKEKMEKADMMFQTEATDLDSFFRPQTKKSTPISENSAMNTKFCEEPNLFSGTGFGTDKKVSPGVFPDDFSSIFEGSPASGVFQEREGESDERRNLRFASYLRAKARMEHAVAEMNQREFKAQQEQEEKHRLADAMDGEMKRWAAGKEGNLRALLSSLQQVLGPEFGWRPVSITDLITSSQVKIAYKRAALCVHPDKVQQRGANLEQKYVAEKAFDLLKEAWNKFSTEELR
ncbi:uncharacterized protein LOC141585825 isoform X2 [Silene latifolia]|uniref:uncharacterized protein LOC141585825 isoform X2 n=1 Tax=Silene latifolia TaxID=37657 RepID=UPI003D789BF5